MESGVKGKQVDALSLLASLDGMTNRRAFITLAATAVISMALGTLAGVLFGQYESWSSTLGSLVLLAAALFFIIGLSACGFILMDHARGIPQRSIMDGFLGALFSLPKLLGILLTQGLILVVTLAAIALLLLICKIPGLGPVLYTFVFPLSAAVCGIVLAGLFYVYTSLSLPSIWDGCTFRETLARLWAITRHRLTLVILMLVFLGFLTMFASAVIWGVTFGGIGVVSLMSAGILDIYAEDILDVMSLLSGSFGDGYIAAGTLGASALMAAAMALPMMLFIKGLCHIYLQSSDGLDFSEAERAISERAEQVRKKAEEAQQRARESVERSRELSRRSTTPITQETSAASTCPSCQGHISRGDTFCEHCGTKLK